MCMLLHESARALPTLGMPTIPVLRAMLTTEVLQNELHSDIVVDSPKLTNDQNVPKASVLAVSLPLQCG